MKQGYSCSISVEWRYFSSGQGTDPLGYISSSSGKNRSIARVARHTHSKASGHQKDFAVP